MSGISVQPRITASQPRACGDRTTCWNTATVGGLNRPATSSSMMRRLVSSHSASLGRTQASPRAASFCG